MELMARLVLLVLLGLMELTARLVPLDRKAKRAMTEQQGRQVLREQQALREILVLQETLVQRDLKD
jgi:hypothetical protein